MKTSTFALALLLSLGAAMAHAGDTKVVLSGAEETPVVTTNASGSGVITVGADRAVSGSITTKDLQATAAHIHAAAPGKSGPPVITLSKTGDNTWSVPAGSSFTDEQYASYLAGNLYINVHSAEHKPGEIRGQLRP
jgi:hypothetical protein